MQLVHRDIVFGEIGGERTGLPIGHRINLDEGVRLVPGSERHVRPGAGMLAAKASHPAARALELAIEGQHFSHMAAALTVLHGMAEAEYAVAGDKRLDLGGVRRHDADAPVIADFGKLDRLQHFGEQAPGVEGENVDIGAHLGNRVQDGLVLKAKTGREGNAADDGAANFVDPVRELRDGGKPRIERLGALLGGIAAKRRGVAVGALIVVTDVLQRSLPDLGIGRIGDLHRVEAGAQQELRKIGDQLTDRPDLALEAVTLAQQRGEAVAASIGEHREIDGHRPCACCRCGKRRIIGGGVQHRFGRRPSGDQRTGGEIKQRHRAPP